MSRSATGAWNVGRVTRVVAGSLVGLTALIIGAFTLGAKDRLTVLAVLLSLLLAAALLGAAAGFLFGMPRYVEKNADKSAYRPSTNLEQVSDWLTKILIGVGLAQASSASRRLDDFLAGSVTTALGEQPGSYIVSLSMIVVGLVLGFQCGWLATRLYLAGALRNADQLVLDQAADIIEGDNPEVAEELRLAAEDIKGAAPTDAKTRAEALELAVLEPLAVEAKALDLDLVVGGRASPWDARLGREDVGSWGVEIRAGSGQMRSSTVRFVAGRLLTAKKPLDGALLVTSQSVSPIAVREAAEFTRTGYPVEIVALPTVEGVLDLDSLFSTLRRVFPPVG